MLVLLLATALVQGGLPPPPPDAIPRADPRMTLDNGAGSPRFPQTPAERQVRAIHEQIRALVERATVTLSAEDRNLLAAVFTAATAEAFSGDKKAEATLRQAVQKLKARASKPVLDALGDIELPNRDARPPAVR